MAAKRPIEKGMGEDGNILPNKGRKVVCECCNKELSKKEQAHAMMVEKFVTCGSCFTFTEQPEVPETAIQHVKHLGTGQGGCRVK